FCSGGERERIEEHMPWIEEFHPIPIMEERGLIEAFVSGTLKRVFSERGLERARVGLDTVHSAQLEAYRRHLPQVEFANGDVPMQRARLIKFPEEIALLEEAAALGDALTRRALDGVRAGRRECELAGDAMQTLYYLGGEFQMTLSPFVGSGEHLSPPMRYATDKIIREGDLVFVDIGAVWNGYFNDVGRTTICGRPTREQKRVYRAVYECLEVCKEAMGPGVTNDQVAEAMLQSAESHGLRERFISLFIGHGIGMSGNEPPYIGETLPGAETVELKPGMVFAVEPLIWLPGIEGGGGVRLEDTILITETGCRALNRLDFEERLLD
ncbi:MAG: M24 family metallopeptidase, partial [Nitrospinota bacterium]